MKVKAIGKRDGVNLAHGYVYGQKFLCGKPLQGFTLEAAKSDQEVTCPACREQMIVLGDAQ
jgi:hypothetical protein